MAVAADIMTRDVVAIPPETPVREVAQMLGSQRFGSVPVVDEHRHVLGVVSEEDLVLRLARLHLPRHITFLGGIIYLENPHRFTEEAEKILAVTAREIMETEAPFVRSDTPVEVVASRLLNDDLRRLLVLDEQDRLIGIITRADIVRMQVTEGSLPENRAI